MLFIQFFFLQFVYAFKVIYALLFFLIIIIYHQLQDENLIKGIKIPEKSIKLIKNHKLTKLKEKTDEKQIRISKFLTLHIRKELFPNVYNSMAFPTYFSRIGADYR